MKKELFVFSTKDIVEGGLMVAMALVLNFIKIPVSITGGSINLQLLPLFIYSFRKGWFKGLIISGVVYGFTSYLTDGYGIILSYPFDYLIGFGSAAIFGLFRSQIKSKKIVISMIFIAICGVLATCIRIVGSTLSSMIIYEYEFLPALIYNLMYIPLSGIIATVVMMIIYKPVLTKIHE